MKKFLLFLFMVFMIGSTKAQTDTEFWFVAPEITIGHGNFPGGEPIYIRVSSLTLPSTVTISQPANPAFTPIIVNLAANETQTIDVSPFVADLENFPEDAILNKGIYITATELITAYYEVGEYWNNDIFALKGKNALGTEFYTPFQNVWPNGNYTPLPYSRIDIVATEDNTTVWITPTQDIVGHVAGVTYSIVLDRGETYSAVATSQAAADHLTGSKITSNLPIAVTISDDSMWPDDVGTCKDLNGDQLVPVSIIGKAYIAMRGEADAGGERFVVLATADNTDVFIDGAFVTTLMEGQAHVETMVNNFYYIETTEKSYVYHIGGFSCELGGALLPPIDKCTGSTQVGFTRSLSSTGGYNLYLNLLVRNGAEDGFILNGDGPNTIINAGMFNPIAGTTDWLAARLGPYADAVIPTAIASLISNTKDIFHIGVINGKTGTGNMYGYFSDFNELAVEAVVTGTGSDVIKICYGDSAQLFASGGVNFMWDNSGTLDDPTISTPIASPLVTTKYTVTVSGACGMTDSASVNVVVFPQLDASFSTDHNSGCSPFEVNFTNTSIGADAYQWMMGTGDTLSTSGPNFSYTYTNTSLTPDTIDIQLVVNNLNDCYDTLVKSIIVYPEVVAGFVPDTTVGCQPLGINFTNTSTGATMYDWEFGDGGSSTLTDPYHEYQNLSLNDTTFNVELIVMSDYLCTDTADTVIMVYSFIDAIFTFEDGSQCSPFPVDFTDGSIGALSYEWTFGDGDTSNTTASTFTHIYYNTTSDSVQYQIQLVATSDDGCMDTMQRIVTVYPEVTSQFTVDTFQGCNPLEVNFANTSVGSWVYLWEFGDGGSSTLDSPTHTYTNLSDSDTTYTVELIAISVGLCSDTSSMDITVYPYLEADFTFEYSTGCSPFNVVINNNSIGATTFEWDLGDGFTTDTTDLQFSHIYTNTTSDSVQLPVTLVVSNSQGCTDTLVRMVTVYPELTSVFSADVTEGCNTLTVNFTDLSTGVSYYNWSYGDGGTSSAPDSIHVFENLSFNDTTYTVQLITNSEFFCSDTSTLDITVYSYLEADFTFEYSTGCSPFTVEFTNSSLGATAYEWDFGDGYTSTADITTFERTYYNTTSDSIQYVISLVVHNDQGCTDTLTRILTVYPEVLAQFSMDTSAGCHPLLVNFTNTSTGIVTYNWSYGDGGSSSSEHPNHIFENLGLTDTTYTIELIATSGTLCADTITATVNVYPNVIADFAIEYTNGCSPFEVEIVNNSYGVNTFEWALGDGDTLHENYDTLHHIYYNDTSIVENYVISLAGMNAWGCADTLDRTIMVYPEVTADFIADTTSGCHPVTVYFENQSINSDTYYWDFGDGNYSYTEDPIYNFLNFGLADTTYTVSLIASSSFMCADTANMEIEVFAVPDASYTLSAVSGCAPLYIDITNTSTGGTEYAWDFGDGNSIITTEMTGTYVYGNNEEFPVTYEMQLIATNANGCDSYYSNSVIVYPEVVAGFTSDTAGCGPFSVAFTNITTGADNYTWDFGDGNISPSIHPINIFESGAENDTMYTVTLTATSDYGCFDSYSDDIYVWLVPDPDFSADPTFQIYPESTVTFDNLTEGSWDYYWDFGDTYFDTMEEPGSHTYSGWGTYTITLYASDEHCEDSVSRTIQIVTPEPEADILDGGIGCPPLTFQFTSSSLYAHSYKWEFGDGSISTEENPVHVYYDPGEYIVKLTVYGDGGEAYDYDTVVVFPNPTAYFTVTPEVVTIPNDGVYCNNLSNLADSVMWYFSDGTIDSAYSPLHVFDEEGFYDIQLSVWSQHGCYDSLYVEDAVEAVTNCVLIYPDAFTPTGARGGSYSFNDNSNDVFYPLHQEIEEYHLQIFNRWGELIFETNDIYTGWDGYYKDKFCKQDVYVWKVRAKCSNGQLIIDAGDVTLYR